MLVKLELDLLPRVEDVQGKRTADKIRNQLNIPVDSVRTIACYTISGITGMQQQEVLEKEVLFDPVLHRPSYTPQAADFDWIIEVGFRPGVTDNQGRTATQTLRMVLGSSDNKIRVYTSRQFLIKGRLSRDQVTHIARDLLANELIERFEIKNSQEWAEEPGFKLVEPRVTGQASDLVETIVLEGLKDEELMNLSREKVLALSLEEMQTIRDYYRDPRIKRQRADLGLPDQPTDVELECLAQTWSEHCKHKIFNARIKYSNTDTGRDTVIESLFNTYIAGSTADIRRARGDGDFCRSVFKDNAGVISFDQDLDVCIKVETHNSPSALDPYGGALTGIVGVNRDPMGTGMGADLLCNTDVFCFASPFHDDPLPPRLLHPRRVMEGVREGVEHGGNKSGIPTVNGAVVFEDRYLGKPLVFCGTVGTIPASIHGRPGHEKKALPGDLIVMTGGRIGKDGIHGATFSSEELHEGSPATAVQIGDPITQRKMYDFIIRARNLGLYNAITDNGAGGLSSSVGEMAEDSGGCDLDLSLAPLKYDGLNPWEILLSEAQERMTLAVPPENRDRFLSLAREMDVEATVLGRFTSDKMFRVFYGKKPVGCLEMDFLHNGLSRMELEAVWTRPEFPDPPVESGERDGAELLKTMLSRLNICSREYIIRQYDHEVQGGSAVKPLVGVASDGPGDAAVVRPDLGKDRGLVISNGICPRFSDFDAYWMMANAIDEAVRNNVAAGGDIRHMAGVDNFCWCDPVHSPRNPDGRYKLAQLVRANQALAHFCRAYGVPCISGKDSMKNDYVFGEIKISIPPTVLYSVISVIEDVNRCVTSDFKFPEEDIFILGLTGRELGGSEYYSELGIKAGEVPQVDAVSARKRYLALNLAMEKGLVTACHDLSDGGLGVALAEMAIGGRIGAEVDLSRVPAVPGMAWTEILFSESASRLLVTLRPECRQAFEALFQGEHMAWIGRTTALPELVMAEDGRTLFKAPVTDLVQAWKKTLDW
ncbi:phosphoribosylformylglycinamidine synthase subunit PurS [Desulfonatronovibrio hydrogenovorans]|uniref:phosphoribosylformylglycinamidine synthase subunit PurS n=1 Tax=Desulfonatronovibrio hydrogenovorans TaxID=53245 RepID=UPI0004920EBA|nr:phosphoribosylformylglycinamidine synthase subunit PurS [Desulfonatronovibrio hydrogenovorans]